MNTRGRLQGFCVLAMLLRRARQDREHIKKVQERKLRRILTGAGKLPFYRALFQAHGLIPASCRLEDLQKIPILTKEILRQILPETVDHHRGKKVSYWKTTGSTGVPLAIAVSEEDENLTNIFIRYASLKNGLKPTDRLCVILVGPDNFKDRTMLQKLGIGRSYTINLHHDLAHTIELLGHMKPDALSSYPSYLKLLATYMQDKKIALPSLRLIITHGELLTPRTRHLLQTAFAATVRDTYGSVEFGRLAYECEYDRLHVIPDTAIIEVINQDEHGVGDALVTSLYHQIMPFVRYQIGDRIKLSNEPCQCGVPFQGIEFIEGRCDDLLVLPSGKRISARAINVLEDVPGLVEYQTIQKQPDYFEIHVKKNSQFTPASAALIHSRIQDGCMGESVHVEVIFEEELVRARTGKLRAVISEVKERAENASGSESQESGMEKLG